MIMEPANAAAFRQSLLSHPGERQNIDYKSSVPFGADDAFSLKLIRHILGMSNSGGGWLVIGYAQDDGQPYPDPLHEHVTCSTYEPTQLSRKVDSHVERGQRVKIEVYQEEHPTSGVLYPLLRVDGFERMPNICRSSKEASDSGEKILKQGAVYVRRPGAETTELSTIADWEEMISRCIRLRRGEFLEEFRDLYERMTSSPEESPGSEGARLQDFLARSHSRAFDHKEDRS